MTRRQLAVAFVCTFAAASAVTTAQRGGMFQGSPDDPAIGYSTGPLNNPVESLNQQLQAGSIRLDFEGRSGYLRSALAALKISVDSQLLVFSPTSLQASRISAANPRALFFADRVVLGWVRDGDIIEVATHDTTRGVAFYTLEQKAVGVPQFKRGFACLGCHAGRETLGVAGLLMFSTRPSSEQSVARSIVTDHRSRLGERWGGWLVTGSSGSAQHLGNRLAAFEGRPSRELSSADGLFDADGYPSKFSDIAALLVFSHQTHMTNLLTRAGWEARAADPTLHSSFDAAVSANPSIAGAMRAIAREVVDYLLFVDEAPLEHGIRGSSGFAERFSAAGPRDSKGRSLYELDLGRRLMKYPCSYLIYSPAFDALPPAAKEPIFERMWQVLSGQDEDPKYRAALPFADRAAIVEILRETKSGLPPNFQTVAR